MKRKRTVVGSLLPPPSSSSKLDDSEVYLLYYLFRGPVRYVMYKIHTSAIGKDDEDEVNGSRRLPNCTTVFELPGQKYPCAMGSFALGSKIYLLGGEVGPHGEADFVRSRGKNTARISEKVYFFDTAVSSSSSPSSSPLSVAPPMRGGKKSPLAIQAYGLVYVISNLPNLCTTYFSEGEPLFEVFNPQGGNEGEGEWTSLPRPPFYPRSSDAGGEEKHRAGRIISHAVVGQLICFFTANKDYGTQEIEALYAFDVLSRHWEHLNDYKTGCGSSPPLRGAVIQVSDSAWAAISSCHCMSPISTFDLSANIGVVERDVEGLESRYLCKPPLVYRIFHHLLDMGNGWFCLLKFGTDNEDLHKGKEHISATVFRLVKKHKDKVSLGRSSHWRLGRTLSLPPDAPRDVSKSVGEIQVFGAEELCSYLFAPGVESFTTFYVAVGFFAMKKECTPSYYPVGLWGTECDSCSVGSSRVGVLT